MANTLKDAFEGALCTALTDSADHADHVVTRSFTMRYDALTEVASLNLIAVAQADITITAAYLVPAVTLAADASNFADLSLGKCDAGIASTSLDTTFDLWSTETGEEGALTIGTKASFTIDESTDVLTTGEGLFLLVDTTAGTGPIVSGTVVVEYKLSN